VCLSASSVVFQKNIVNYREKGDNRNEITAEIRKGEE
jgi:hypothetical protein